jgi:hypothetical protein
MPDGLAAQPRDLAIKQITGVEHITTKQDMSRWARAHEGTPGINWSVFPGEGGTMIIVEYAEDRSSRGTDASRSAVPAGGPRQSRPVPAAGREAA